MKGVQQIRNQSGKLLCELAYSGGRWVLRIKRGECYTSLSLYPDGAYYVMSSSEFVPTISLDKN